MLSVRCSFLITVEDTVVGSIVWLRYIRALQAGKVSGQSAYHNYDGCMKHWSPRLTWNLLEVFLGYGRPFIDEYLVAANWHIYFSRSSKQLYASSPGRQPVFKGEWLKQGSVQVLTSDLLERADCTTPHHVVAVCRWNRGAPNSPSSRRNGSSRGFNASFN